MAAATRRRGLVAIGLLIAFVQAMAAPFASGAERQEGFAALVKRVSPAVVNIRAVHRVDRSPVVEPLPPATSSQLDMPSTGWIPPSPGLRRPPMTRDAIALGSGFVVDPSGVIVTNQHVVGGASRIVVTLASGEAYQASYVGGDARTDLAVLRIEPRRMIAAVTWGDSERTEVGDPVLAIGNPFGLGGTVTAGIISARGREIGGGPIDEFLQLDAPINQGNSGGPSFNIAGEVIGVNTAIVSPTGVSIGLGFAIPSNQARQIVDELRRAGRIERGWLGVSVQMLNPTLALAFGLPPEQVGAAVAQLHPDSPATIAGLRQGDVIVAVNAMLIVGLHDLSRFAASHKPGDAVALAVLRGGETIVIRTTLGRLLDGGDVRRPSAPLVGAGRSNRVAQAIGMDLYATTPDIRRRHGIPAEVRGVYIGDVALDGLAAEQQLEPGDIILSADGRPVTRPSEVLAALRAALRARRPASALLVTRRGLEFYAAIDLRGLRP